jgi:AbrB family looped-hinge helix DNA binding protein
MGNKVILRQMGGSIGATIPKELAEKYHLEKGDEIFIYDTEEGILLSPYDP